MGPFGRETLTAKNASALIKVRADQPSAKIVVRYYSMYFDDTRPGPRGTQCIHSPTVMYQAQKLVFEKLPQKLILQPNQTSDWKNKNRFGIAILNSIIFLLYLLSANVYEASCWHIITGSHAQNDFWAVYCAIQRLGRKYRCLSLNL